LKWNSIDEDCEILDCRVLDVSVEAVEAYKEDVNKILGEVEENACKIIHVHFGVATEIENYNLEKCAYNMMDFRCPDVSGFHPKDEVIDEGEEKGDCLRSDLELEMIGEEIKTRGEEEVNISTDPGFGVFG